ncbi:AP2 domain-containing protein [Paenibacillus glycanilyticus]|uniref:AP2 domain-containing protein n=1 Tax=Paenibacillus glycanilyticus TaxID=126569 RepID=UPI0019111F71|nr:AP2 domain-containing protein [Paenibacillus glycanilyticus]
MSAPPSLSKSRGTVHLHRWLFDEPQGLEIDHINNNGLDNRRSVNLREASKSENAQNRKGAQINSKSGIRGVHYREDWGKWIVQIATKGKKKIRVAYDTIEEAEKAAVEARRKLMPFSKEALRSGS